MKKIEILNNKKNSNLIKNQLKKQSKQQYPATKIALIKRNLSGKKTLTPGKNFSIENLN